ncbi:MAG TPA: ABC transporter permease [Clostridiales bacterium]|nr:MAG: ABC transporter permease [Clostridiales bacterium GWD2_32_59]HAN10695.1 ABC transporter permease [Clostridiales bacterium]
MKASQKAMIYKDVKEIMASRQMFIPMMSVPIIMMVIIPIIYLIGAKYSTAGWSGMDSLMNILATKFSNLTNPQLLIQLGLNYMFPVFFLLIPIMASSIIGASSFVGEKERKTMESLFYTPLTIRELFVAKVIGTFIPSYLLSLISGVLFGIVMNVGGWFYFEELIFPNIKWTILIFWLTPAVTLLGINLMVFISAKANTFQEAHQMGTFLILPVIFVIAGQMSGLFILSNFSIITAGVVVYIIDYLLMKTGSKKFVPEKLI